VRINIPASAARPMAALPEKPIFERFCIGAISSCTFRVGSFGLRFRFDDTLGNT
jgi:hypothetical protein